MKHNRKEKKKGGDDLDEMREAYRRHKERGKGGGSGKSDWDALDNGKNLRRVLPRPEHRKFYTEGWTHFNVGPNDRAVRCIDEAHIDLERGLPMDGTRCPLCKKFLREQARINGEFPKGDQEGRDQWKEAKDKWVPRHQYYSNVLREDDEGDFEVKLLAYGPQVWGQFMNYYLGDDTEIGDFTNVESGRWVNIKKEKKGGSNRRNVEYKVFPQDDVSDLSDAWDDIKEALHDLEAAPGKILSKDEVLAILKGINTDKESDGGDDDDDSDDDASDRRSKKRRSRDDDDDDDDDDQDDGDEDEDEEEEEEEDEDDRAVRVKKSKLAKKMKRRDDD